jgi:predicted phage-related endonuclease
MTTATSEHTTKAIESTPITQLVALATAYKDYKRLEAELSAEINEISAKIKTLMTSNHLNTVYAGTYRIAYREIASTRIDTKTLKAALPDVAARYSVTSTTARLTVD